MFTLISVDDSSRGPGERVHLVLPMPGVANEPQDAKLLRDPEDRIIDEFSIQERKEKMMDKTIADSFPASDPPSSLPDPDRDSFGTR